jgi:hypothetical protein
LGRFQTHQREASLNLVGAIIPPWRGVPDVTTVDRKSRSLDRFTGNSPCSRRAILGWPSQPTRAIRAGPRTPVRARPSAKRSRSIRCDRLTRRRPVRIRRKWTSEAPRLAGQGRRRWIMNTYVCLPELCIREGRGPSKPEARAQASTVLVCWTVTCGTGGETRLLHSGASSSTRIDTGSPGEKRSGRRLWQGVVFSECKSRE